MKLENNSPLVLDFGQINADYSLQTNTFPIAIPRTDYSICRSVSYGTADTLFAVSSTEASPESHNHRITLPDKLKTIVPGDRVLVAWVQNEPVVIDIILSASKI